MRIGFALLAFVALVAFAVVPAGKFSGKFRSHLSCLWWILIAAAFVEFLGHPDCSFRLIAIDSLAAIVCFILQLKRVF